MASMTDEEKFIGVLIIGNIDEDGYLQTSVEELAKELQLTDAEVEQALKKIQEFEPVGVGARTLQECLLIQIGLNAWTTP